MIFSFIIVTILIMISNNIVVKILIIILQVTDITNATGIIIMCIFPPSGGPSFQVIQAFATLPPQVVNIPVSNALGPGGPTYVLGEESTAA